MDAAPMTIVTELTGVILVLKDVTGTARLRS